ncbi:MAG TPA: endonuclease domain-containing protein [Phenylobacterium sp.]|nr:endonuclease domain-containing protein [Phenylobacterium sp.]
MRGGTPTAPRHATVNQARALRRRATLIERTLWTLLRDRRLTGLKFRRQVPKGPYVLDFFCFAHGLAIETDGPIHDPVHDAARDRWLAAQGLRVLRLPNRDILGAAPSVIAKIPEAAQATASLLPGENGPAATSSLEPNRPDRTEKPRQRHRQRGFP